MVICLKIFTNTTDGNMASRAFIIRVAVNRLTWKSTKDQISVRKWLLQIPSWETFEVRYWFLL